MYIRRFATWGALSASANSTRSLLLVKAPSAYVHFHATIQKQQQHKRLYASDAGFTKDSTKAQDSMTKGVSALSSGNAQIALDHFIHALSVGPSSDVHYNIGLCYCSLGDIEKALSHWKKSIDLDPTKVDSHVNYGNLSFMHKKDADTSIFHLEKAVELDPNDAEIQFNLACIYEATGKLELAIDMYRRAEKNGLEKAKLHLRNVTAKLMGQNK
ncbi:hypothetical protein EV175_002810 [Coemansia sp. RSA 1933]|nr:hypothetical protein EV175_002810 [Coemansia sp. RSA 1933]